MTDEELLEYAAKAVWGYSPTKVTKRGVQIGLYSWWNPLEHDADAFRLMTNLGIDIEWRVDGRVAAYRHANSDGHCFTAIESSREDRVQNTRRAIVRAAAEIGRSMGDD